MGVSNFMLKEKQRRLAQLEQAKDDWNDAIILSRQYDDDGTELGDETMAAMNIRTAALRKEFLRLESEYKKDYRLKHSPLL
jgi:hypothetical protein